jgi:hypothetical protein
MITSLSSDTTLPSKSSLVFVLSSSESDCITTTGSKKEKLEGKERKLKRHASPRMGEVIPSKVYAATSDIRYFEFV